MIRKSKHRCIALEVPLSKLELLIVEGACLTLEAESIRHSSR